MRMLLCLSSVIEKRIFKVIIVVLFGGVVYLIGMPAGDAATTAPPQTYHKEPPQQRDARMSWWREARFGMFIHWGLYAIPAGEWEGEPVRGIGEWIMNRGKITKEDYVPLQRQFNPVHYDARQWVRIAKDAGMKYIVITSKHHDGFCLWDSALTEFDVMNTPYGQDLLAPLAEACREEGLAFCLYHSIMDWTHPDYVPLPKWDQARKGHRGNYGNYVEYMKGQLHELVANYDPAVLWFDGEWEPSWTHEHGKMLYDYCRSLKPSVLVNNRVDKGRRGMQGLTRAGEYRGDFGTPEQEIPEHGLPGVDWESCMTMNDTWGFKKNDHNWKSSKDLIRKLIDIASKGGNFLLNVGPTAEGTIPEPSVERLAAMGKWLKVNGEAIYGTSANPLEKSPSWGRCTKRSLSGTKMRLYLHVFDWPKEDELVVPELRGSVTRAYPLANPYVTLPVQQLDDSTRITVSGVRQDPVATVVVLDIVVK